MAHQIRSKRKKGRDLTTWPQNQSRAGPLSLSSGYVKEFLLEGGQSRFPDLPMDGMGEDPQAEPGWRIFDLEDYSSGFIDSKGRNVFPCGVENSLDLEERPSYLQTVNS